MKKVKQENKEFNLFFLGKEDLDEKEKLEI
jgi:hypothetical protein